MPSSLLQASSFVNVFGAFFVKNKLVTSKNPEIVKLLQTCVMDLPKKFPKQESSEQKYIQQEYVQAWADYINFCRELCVQCLEWGSVQAVYDLFVTNLPKEIKATSVVKSSLIELYYTVYLSNLVALFRQFFVENKDKKENKKKDKNKFVEFEEHIEDLIDEFPKCVSAQVWADYISFCREFCDLCLEWGSVDELVNALHKILVSKLPIKIIEADVVKDSLKQLYFSIYRSEIDDVDTECDTDTEEKTEMQISTATNDDKPQNITPTKMTVEPGKLKRTHSGFISLAALTSLRPATPTPMDEKTETAQIMADLAVVPPLISSISFRHS